MFPRLIHPHTPKGVVAASTIDGIDHNTQHQNLDMHVRRGGEPVQATHESGAVADIHSHADPGPTRFDTGGVLSGSEDSYWFAKAYAGIPPCVRERVLDLSAPGGQDGHAIARVVRAEVGVLRELDAEIREIPSDELERAILRSGGARVW